MTRLWMNIETGDFWFGNPPSGNKIGLTLFRASSTQRPDMTLQTAAQTLADNESAVADLAFDLGVDEGSMHLALETLARSQTP